MKVGVIRAMRFTKSIKIIASLLICALLLIIPSKVSCHTKADSGQTWQKNCQVSSKADSKKTSKIKENGQYSSKEDVALYIHTYNKLPRNFITKNKARQLGWQGGGLDDYMYGACIGGSSFGNYEGKLPEKKGRRYYECDIDTLHKNKRGAKRIIYSNDGLIYYTEDHYETFVLLYGK